MTTAFVIDLSGYSKPASALATAQSKSQSIVVSLLDKHCFVRSHDGDSALGEIDLRLGGHEQ